MYTRSNRRRGLGDALVDCLSSAITQVEGYNPNFAGNNNPGNLIYVGQPGAVPGAGGFAKFSSPSAGQAALQWQVQNYIDRGYTPTQFFNTWAPPNTKNAAGGAQTSQMTTSYISRVSSQCGLDPNVPLNQVQAGYAGDNTDTFSSADASLVPASDWLSSLSSSLPGSDQSYDVAGVVLSGSQLLLIGIASLAGLLILSKL